MTDITQTELERHTERVRKLLALAESSNPNEAAIAKRRAEHLMEKYAIDFMQLDKAEFAIGAYETATIDNSPWKRKLFSTLGSIIGVECSWMVNRNRKYVHTVYGRKPNVDIALYVFSIVEAGMRKSWKEHSKLHGLGGKLDWHKAFSIGVCSKVVDIYRGLSNEGRVDLGGQLKESKKFRDEGGGLREMRRSKERGISNYDAASYGLKAGESQNIHMGVSGGEESKLIEGRS